MESTVDYYDRAKDVKEFDESKTGVKGLVDSGITAIPRIFIHPPENLIGLRSPHPGAIQIPTVDLSDFNANPARSHIVQQIRDAAGEFGFFQIVNHGIPIPIMDGTLSAVKSFHELPTEKKKPHYDRSRQGGVFYMTNLDLLRSKAATWADTLGIEIAPVPPDWERVPASCRSELMEWSMETKKLAGVLAELLCEGLGFHQDRLKELKCLESRVMAAHIYPPCPQPDLTLGTHSHTDPLLLTILLQNELEGLQVKIGEEWVTVKPIHGGLVVNIGDILQSVQHRVAANPHKKPRISVAAFFGPTEKENSLCYGPLPELLSEEKPAFYRSFTMTEFITLFYNKELCALKNNFKL
ncbi:1-aminocyclopropane-1-carboxylate oxidase homolog 1-like [Aristolochia californica]|uniref:1-aminocyclopropane-1-carboxylate oxidase homolog 1-like n=1 Tax=Aristolochia californica TaxID=171875 RepID=UPI0035D942AD